MAIKSIEDASYHVALVSVENEQKQRRNNISVFESLWYSTSF